MTDRRQALKEISGGHERDRREMWYSLRGVDLNPEAITSKTGIQPDEAWRMGDARPRTGRPYREGAWIVFSGLGENAEFHDHLDAMLARLAPAWGAFVEFGTRYEAEITAAIYLLEAQGPLVEVLPDASAALADLNAALGFDLYAVQAAGATRSLTKARPGGSRTGR